MRIVPLIVSGISTIVLITVLNTQLPAGGSKTPRLGYFLSPQQGFWLNAESTEAKFDADIHSKDLKGKVDVYMDDRLVPHIYAENDPDAYFVQGFLHAKFRLWQMEFQTHVAAGRLSEIVGKERIETDRFFRRLGMVYGAEQTLAAMNKDPEMKATIDAYTKGVNAYISSLTPEQIPFEYKLLNYQPEPWTPLKTYLFLMFMSYDLTARGATTDLQMTNAKNYFGIEDLDKLYPNIQDSLDPIIPKGTVYQKPSIIPQAPKSKDIGVAIKNAAPEFTAFNDPGIAPPDKNNGSNNWAVSGSKTASGKPILCNDPHLGLNLPSLWYEMQITTPTHSTYGASFPGSPAVIIGFNDSIAWGVTNAGRDVIDYYNIVFRDSTMQEYQYNGAWVKAEHRKEVIKVKGDADRTEDIAMTVFGPVMYDRAYKNISTEGKYLALHWTAHEPSTGVQAFYKLNRAKNYNDYIAAIDQWKCPGQNFVFASKSGDIAIKQQGSFIARWKHQGDFIMPGTDSSYRWQGMIPSSENPMIKNPARGFVSSANQKSTDTTYPYYLGASNNFPLYRGIIINRELAGMSNITPADMQRLQMENYNVFAEVARPQLLKFIDKKALSESEKKYVGILENWNLHADTKEQGSTVFNAIWDSLEVAVWGDEIKQAKLPLPWPDESTLLESILRGTAYWFADDVATKDVKETFGDDVMIACRKACAALAILDKEKKLDWEVFKDTRVNHLLKIPALGRFHLPIGGGTNMINATNQSHGPSWRMIVHMTDETEAYCVYPGGQNGNPGSKYYDTFVDTWAAGKYYRILFVKKAEAIASHKIQWHLTFSNS